MPVKIARSTPRPSFGLRELLVASHISRLASRDAAKSLLSTLVSELSGECRFKSTRQKECVQMPGEAARSDPRPSVRVTRGAVSGQHLASVLQEGRENANIDGGLGFHLENLG